jgi:hypothetical protein
MYKDAGRENWSLAVYLSLEIYTLREPDISQVFSALYREERERESLNQLAWVPINGAYRMSRRQKPSRRENLRGEELHAIRT